MYVTTQNFTQLQTVFGVGYIPEQHADETHRYLSSAERPIGNVDEAINTLMGAMFDEVMKSLRAALSLR